MKSLIALLPVLFLATAVAGEAPAQESGALQSSEGVHRYIVERTFPAGALDGLDDAAKAKVNAINASVGVRWLHSYANADMTKTYCVYEGPSEEAVRKAAMLNNMSADKVTEVPVDLDP